MKLPVHQRVGILKKSYGRKGALRIKLDEEYRELLDDVDHFYLDIQGQYIPFFIRSIDPGPPLTVQFESVETPEESKRIAGATLFIREAQVDGDFDLPVDERELLKGYFAVDGQGGEIGCIEDIREMPQQMMAVVLIDGKERYIPLHPDLILGIDEQEEIIQFDLPEGMLDL